MLDSVRHPFRAIAETVVPEAGRLDRDGWSDLEQIVAAAIAQRPPRLRRQLLTLVRVVELLPVLRYGSRFSALDSDRRARVLAALQDAPVLLLRRGIWGLRTLILMGYYGRAAAMAEIGYRASPRGWEARA